MTAALTVTLVGLLLNVAAAAWAWGPIALAVGGMLITLFGVFVVDVNPRDRR